MDPTHAFVGRDPELAALRGALADVEAGRGRLVLLAGEGGIGKTRLLEEFVRRAGLPPERVLWARCPEQSGAPTYWPWTQLLRRYAGVHPDEALRADLGDAAGELGRLVPAIAQRLGLPPAADVGGDDARFQLFDGFGHFLARAAADAPLVVVLDDLHWADPASIDLLQYLATELRDARVLMLATLRPREMSRRPEAMGALARVGTRIALGGLDLRDVRRLVAPALPETADEVVATLRDATGGNPFFLRELVSALREVGPGAVDPGALHAHLPESLRAAIRARLAPLAADRDVLDTAAVVGAEFDLPVLAHACGMDVARALELLSNAQAAGILGESGDVPGRFRFAHALLREAVYGDLLPAARMHAHRRVAHALEALHHGRSDAPHGALAHHYSRCAALGEAEAAMRWAGSAAAQAAALGAWSEAAAHHTQALNAAMLLPPDEPLRHRLRIALGHASTRAGDDLGAREIFRRALDAARSRGDRGAALVACIGHAAAVAQPAIPDAAGIAVLEEALAHPVDGQPVARAQAQAILSWKLYFSDRDRARVLAEEAVAAARALGDRSALAVALLALHYTRWDPDGVAERTAIADEALALTRTGVAPTLGWEALRLRVTDALDAGDVVGAGMLVEEYVRHVETNRAPRHLAIGDFLRGSRALLLGRLDEAEQHRLRAVERRPPSALNNTGPYAAFQQLVLGRARGDTSALAAPLGAMAEQLPHMPLWRIALGVVAADEGRLADARHALDAVAADDFRTLRFDCNWLPTLALAAELATSVGDAPRAARLYDLLAPRRHLWITFGLGAASLGPVEHHLGLLALALGRPDDAGAHLDRALAVQSPGNVVLPHFETLRARAQAADAGGDAALAAELRAAADRTAERLGLARATAPPVPAGPAPAPGASPSRQSRRASLRREGEYWTVAHDGAVARVKDTKGVRYLATLVAEPGREFHVLELAGGEAADAMSAGEAAQAGLSAGDLGDAGELLDPAARRAYQRRAAELRQELEEAESFHDVGRAERLRQELEFLADELARGVGLGGRDRKAASAAERARQNVTRAILVVVRKIATDLPPLGEHLQATVRTGTFCSYAPDERLALAWDVG